MAWTDRFRGIAGRAGDALQSFGRASPRVPGIGQPPSPIAVPADSKQAKLANAIEALYGRMTIGAGPTPTRYPSYVGSGLNPYVVNEVLREANNGIVYRWADLDEQVLERDAHMAGVDRSRRVEVAGKPFRVHAASDDPAAGSIAKLVEAMVDGIDGFDSSVYALLGANSVGWSGAENVYTEGSLEFPGVDGKRIALDGIWPRSVEWVHPKHFGFQVDTDEPLINLGTGGLISLPEYKFIFHGAAGQGFYEHRGYLRRTIWLHMAKSKAFAGWFLFAEIFGIPQVLAKYDAGRAQLAELQAIYGQVLQDLGAGKPAIVPSEFDLEFAPAATGGNADGVHATLIGVLNAEISKAIQGETLTTEMTAGGVGAYNASESHAAVKHRIVEMDARALAADLRRDLFYAVLKLNKNAIARALGIPPERVLKLCPRASWRIEREVTPLQRAQIADILANKLGMELDAGQLRDDFGFNVPRPGGERTRGAPVLVSDGAQAVGSAEAARGIDNPKPEEQPTQAARGSTT